MKAAESLASLPPISQYTSASAAAAPIIAAASTVANMPQPNNELLQFIEKQEGYIEQLERESQFCRVSFPNADFAKPPRSSK